MRTIPFLQVVETVRLLCIESAYRLPDDVLEAIERARQAEPDERAGNILELILAKPA